jgi:secreted PhoX family phosphatase
MISSDDTIKTTPDFLFGGGPDGQAFLKNPDGTGYIVVTNHEYTWAVSRIYLDKKLNPVKGEYLMDSDGGMFRLCSATLATPEEHGFPKMLYLTRGEADPNGMTHALDPLATATPKDKSRVKPALGKFSGENNVPLPKEAYAGKTVILLTEDAESGQVYMYLSDTPGDLENGKLYIMRRKDLNPTETAIVPGTTYDVEFVEAVNAKNLTGAELESLAISLKTVSFGRVEDIDYRKGGGANSRELYFSSTGMNNRPAKTKWGRVYRLRLDATSPLGGKLDILSEGDSNPGNDLINPDNICVTTNYVYIQEDGDNFYAGANHNSLIWQYDIATGVKKKFIDTKNRVLAGTRYNPASDMRFGLWEFGAMLDISDIIGVPGTFTLNLHVHSWKEGNRFLNPSKASTPVDAYTAGGQMLILTGVPR